ncbi:MAG: carbohydrate binding family 9 domain-containing protein [Acidobacteria bacterium]|nr:carbohydrate binding family 9 domain-containing protein [Acidobacteriota bacterium]
MKIKFLGFLSVCISLCPARSFASVRVEATKIEKAIILDGRLEEPEWRAAPPATDFVQQRPQEEQPSSERTEVRFLYNSSKLFIGIICYDSEPARIVDVQSRRDGDLSDSDSILIILDTYHDRRNGFLFGTNPSGIQYDAQIMAEGVSGGQMTAAGVGRSAGGTTQRGNVAAVNLNWDADWKVQTSRDSEGWKAEIEIPLGSLRFKGSESPQTWGLNVMRNIRRKNEQSFWSPIPQAYNIYRVSLAGELAALDIRPPRNLRLIPYISLGPHKDYSKDKTDFRREVGFDVKYGLTPTLTLDVTANTDFAQVEVDDEQINLSRFDLFFPEKRAFFLENAGTFAFGVPRETDLFFSRRIGIEGGREVPILGGGRLTGKLGRYNLGILAIETGREGIATGNNFFVSRVRREFQRRSSVGFIYTNRETVGDGLSQREYNHAFGSDLQLGFGENWLFSGYIAKTYSPHLQGDDYAGNLHLSYRTDVWRIEGDYAEVQENFNPEVGFVPRHGYRSPFFRIVFSPSPEKGWIRQWNPHFTIRRHYGFDGRLESERQHYDLEIFRTDGGQMSVTYNRDQELLRVPFEIHPGVFVPPGAYRFGQFEAFFSSDPAAKFFGSFNLTRGDFYDGDLAIYDFELGFRTGPQFFTTLNLVNTGVEADWGRFNTNLARLRLNYSFTPTRFLQALFQYNSRLNQFSSNIRFGWINASNTGLYMVYNDRYNTRDDRLDPLDRAFFLKFSYGIDF